MWPTSSWTVSLEEAGGGREKEAVGERPAGGPPRVEEAQALEAERGRGVKTPSGPSYMDRMIFLWRVAASLGAPTAAACAVVDQAKGNSPLVAPRALSTRWATPSP